MESKKRLITSFIFNILEIILVIIGVILMFTIGSGALASNKIDVLKYFTLQSNLFMAAISLIVAFYQFMMLKGKKKEVPYPLVVTNLVATCAVGVTFSVVIFILGRLYGYDKMYNQANLFFHLLAPVCALVNFLFIQKDQKVKFAHTPFGLLPCLSYGIVYFIVVASLNGYGDLKIDFYGFGTGGPLNGIINFAIILVITYVLILILYFVNYLILQRKKK